MPQRSFGVSRARLRRQKSVTKSVVRPVASLAEAGRQRPRRGVQRTSPPTLTSLSVAAGWMSKRRLAGSGEFAEQERINALRPAGRPTDGWLSGFAAPAAQDRLDAERKPLVAPSHANPSPSEPQPGLGSVNRRGAHAADWSPGIAEWSPAAAGLRASSSEASQTPGSSTGPVRSGDAGHPAPVPSVNGSRTGSATWSTPSDGATPGPGPDPVVPAAEPAAPAASTPAGAAVGPAGTGIARTHPPAGRRPGRQSPHPLASGRTGPGHRQERTTADHRAAKAKAAPRAGGEGTRKDGEGEDPEATAPPGKPRRTGRIIGWTLLGAGAIVLLGSAWVGWRTYDAYSHLQAASSDVTRLQDQLKDVTTADPNATAGVVGDMQAEAAAARSAVDDPIVRAASVLPFVGPNLDAIHEVTVTVDSLASDVMPSLVEIARTLQPSELAPKDGAINLEPIEKISPLLQSADVAVNEARQTLDAIDQSALVQPVGDAVRTLSGKLDDAAEVTGPGARTARLLPPMLGSAGQRTYLVLFQNPAETRATGGIFGSYALVTADNGKVTIVDQGSASRDLGYFDPAVGEIGGNELALYGNLMNRYPQDVNFTPDFPTAAELFAQMYQVRTGTTVDGVVAIDPVALSYMLEGSPGVDIGQGLTMTSENLVPTLLSDAYKQFDGVPQSQRDDFLDDATNKVFAHVMSGDADPKAIIDGLRKASNERRVLVYSANGDEQGDISKTGIAGSLNSDPAQPSVGVFMNDGTAGKLDYYLHNEVHVTEGDCRTDGRRELKVRVVMNYDAPTEGLPEYVTQAQPGQPYALKTNLLTFAPLGGGVISAERDGTALPIARGEDHSREVGTATIEMLPQTSTEITFTLGRAGRRNRWSERRSTQPDPHPRGQSLGHVGG